MCSKLALIYYTTGTRNIIAMGTRTNGPRKRALKSVREMSGTSSGARSARQSKTTQPVDLYHAGLRKRGPTAMERY